MKQILFVLTFCSGFIFPSLFAQKTVHAVLVIDTENVNKEFAEIGQADYKNMNKELEEMAGGAGYGLKIYQAIGTDFTPEQVKATVNSVRAGADDVIIFYYSGASFCEEGSAEDDLTRILQLGKDGRQLLSTEGLFATLQSKNARLNIFIVDGCSIEKQIEQAGITRNATIHNVYTSLLSACGTIWIFSSKCSQYSYGDEKGSFFTNAFIDAIDHFINIGTQELTWKTLMTWAQASTMKMAMEIARVQQPVVELGQLVERCE